MGGSDLSLKDEWELIRETSIFQTEGTAGAKAWRRPKPPHVLVLSRSVWPAQRMWRRELWGDEPGRQGQGCDHHAKGSGRCGRASEHVKPKEETEGGRAALSSPPPPSPSPLASLQGYMGSDPDFVYPAPPGKRDRLSSWRPCCRKRSSLQPELRSVSRTCEGKLLSP